MLHTIDHAIRRLRSLIGVLLRTDFLPSHDASFSTSAVRSMCPHWRQAVALMLMSRGLAACMSVVGRNANLPSACNIPEATSPPQREHLESDGISRFLVFRGGADPVHVFFAGATEFLLESAGHSTARWLLACRRQLSFALFGVDFRQLGLEKFFGQPAGCWLEVDERHPVVLEQRDDPDLAAVSLDPISDP